MYFLGSMMKITLKKLSVTIGLRVCRSFGNFLDYQSKHNPYEEKIKQNKQINKTKPKTEKTPQNNPIKLSDSFRCWNSSHMKTLFSFLLTLVFSHVLSMEIPAKEWQQGLQKKLQSLLSFFFFIVFFILTI